MRDAEYSLDLIEEVLGLLRRAYLVKFIYADKNPVAPAMDISRHAGGEAAELGHDLRVAQRLLRPRDTTR